MAHASPIPIPQEFGQKICASLGLDADKVLKIVLTVAPGDIVTAEVTVGVDTDLAGEVLSEIHKYRLVRNSD